MDLVFQQDVIPLPLLLRHLNLIASPMYVLVPLPVDLVHLFLHDEHYQDEDVIDRHAHHFNQRIHKYTLYVVFWKLASLVFNQVSHLVKA